MEKCSPFEVLPTRKRHVSFSEVKEWSECSWRHKLHHVDGHGEDQPGPALEFGSAIHEACESTLMMGEFNDEARNKLATRLDEAWKKHGHIESFVNDPVENAKNDSAMIMEEVIDFLDETFPGWTPVTVEHQLYESINGHPHAFKGFIDAIIDVPPSGSKKQTRWLLDWKSCKWGWSQDQKSDQSKRNQLVYYKNFYAAQQGMDPKDIRCGFVLLKRSAKPGSRLELIPVSVGDVTVGRSLKVLNNMITSVKRGIAIKNRTSCTWCEFKDTELCT